jgi:hypothetical protein
MPVVDWGISSMEFRSSGIPGRFAPWSGERGHSAPAFLKQGRLAMAYLFTVHENAGGKRGYLRNEGK